MLLMVFINVSIYIKNSNTQTYDARQSYLHNWAN